MYIINQIEQTHFVQLEMLVYIEALCEKPIFLIERIKKNLAFNGLSRKNQKTFKQRF